jgi:CheY-like chemotaxis protein
LTEPRARSVLLVEDSTLLAILLQDALLAHGVATVVEIKPDPHAFLARYRAAVVEGVRPVLLVIDIVLPDFDGLIAGERVRAIERELAAEPVPIVFFSSRSLDEDVQAAVDACFPARYVEKKVGGPVQVALQGALLLREITGARDA